MFMKESVQIPGSPHQTGPKVSMREEIHGPFDVVLHRPPQGRLSVGAKFSPRPEERCRMIQGFSTLPQVFHHPPKPGNVVRVEPAPRIDAAHRFPGKGAMAGSQISPGRRPPENRWSTGGRYRFDPP